MAATAAARAPRFDAASEALCLQLQLEDLGLFAASDKGKNVAGTLSDEQLARQLYDEELKQASRTWKDRVMVESIRSAVRTDGPGISAELARADCVARDHELALRISEASPSRRRGEGREATSGIPEPLDEELVEKLEALYMMPNDEFEQSEYEDIEVTVTPASGSKAPAPRAWKRKERRIKTRPCVICRDDFRHFELARVPCGHEYCQNCLQELLQAATTDEQLYPPRCCHKPFDLQRLRLFVPYELIKTVESKDVEFSTRNRTYCHEPRCSAFIPPARITNDVATCPSCRKNTCTTCKGGTHEGDCPQDQGLRLALDLATNEGWQRCPECWTCIELREGCYHITCRCGHQFCYVCGERWKTCACEQWDNVRLRRRARQLVDRNAAAPLPEIQHVQPEPAIEAHDEDIEIEGPVEHPAPLPEMDRSRARAPPPAHRDVDTHVPRFGSPAVEAAAPAPAYDILVRQMMNNLEQNHECEHSRWRRVSGRHQCEECLHTLPLYIFECGQCRIHACNRCRLNRF